MHDNYVVYITINHEHWLGYECYVYIRLIFHIFVSFRAIAAEPDLDVVCFERRSTVGGLWNYEESPSTQTYLTPVYKNLR